MALIRCPECGREVSDQAEMCPGCGYNVKQYYDNLQKEEKGKLQ
ncbi:zinc ribbon domain-containing protein [Clostridium vitabionis]